MYRLAIDEILCNREGSKPNSGGGVDHNRSLGDGLEQRLSNWHENHMDGLVTKRLKDPPIPRFPNQKVWAKLNNLHH